MDPNIVKVVLDFNGDALYFSRAPIPWVRDTTNAVHARHLKHLGLYAYRREALLDYRTLPPGDLERLGDPARRPSCGKHFEDEPRPGRGRTTQEEDRGPTG